MEVRLKAGCLLRLFGALDRVQRTHSSGRAGCSKSPRLMHGLSVGWHVTAFLCRALLRSGDPLLEGLLRRLFPSLSSSGAACGELSLAFCAEVRDRGGGGKYSRGHKPGRQERASRTGCPACLRILLRMVPSEGRIIATLNIL